MNCQILQKSLGTHHVLPPSRNSYIPQKWILLKTFWLIQSFLSVLGNNLFNNLCFGKDIWKKEESLIEYEIGLLVDPKEGGGLDCGLRVYKRRERNMEAVILSTGGKHSC